MKKLLIVLLLLSVSSFAVASDPCLGYKNLAELEKATRLSEKFFDEFEDSIERSTAFDEDTKRMLKLISINKKMQINHITFECAQSL